MLNGEDPTAFVLSANIHRRAVRACETRLLDTHSVETTEFLPLPPFSGSGQSIAAAIARCPFLLSSTSHGLDLC